jgi:ketosteroid isomerase-like protein
MSKHTGLTSGPFAAARNVDVVRRGWEAINREGLPAALRLVDEVVDPDIELRATGRLPDVGRVRGHEAFKKWFAQILGTFEWRLEADEFIDAGDAVVVVARQVTRGRASGAEVSTRPVFVYGFRGGRVTYIDAHRTKSEALKAVGLRE